MKKLFMVMFIAVVGFGLSNAKAMSYDDCKKERAKTCYGLTGSIRQQCNQNVEKFCKGM